MADDQSNPNNTNGSNNGGLTKEKDVLDPTKSGEKQSKGAVQDIKDKAKGVKNTVSTAKNVVTFLTSNPIGWVIGIILIIIIVVVGFYYFFTTIPGLAMAQLKAMLQGGIDLVQSWFTTTADAYINDEDIVELANYLEELEYDLVGNGFIVPTSRTTSEYPAYEELIEAGYSYGTTEYDSDGDGELESAYRYYLDDENEIYGVNDNYITDDDGNIKSETSYYYNSIGVLIDNKTGSVVDEDTYTDEYGLERSTEELATSGQGIIKNMGEVDTTLLRTYLLSDYRIYAIKNLDEDFGADLYNAIKSTFGGYSSSWAKGLLKFYYASDGIATEAWGADFLSSLTGGAIDIGDAISISDDGKTMTLKKGYFNNAMDFKIDGWADRYGLSLEFLLSLHLATGAPDLVYAMLQNFDIEVQVYLNDTEDATATGGYVDLVNDDATVSDLISWDDVITAVDQASEWGVINWWQKSTTGGDDDIVGVDSWSYTKKYCQYLLETLNLTSPDNCLGSVEWYKILKSTYETDLIFDNNVLSDSYNITEDIDPDIYDDVEGYSGYEFTTDSGGTEEFKMKVVTHAIGTDDESYLEDDYVRFSGTAQSYGYYDADDAETTIEAVELETTANTGPGTKTYFTTERTKRVSTWTAEVTNEDGTTEEVEFEWVSYKYLIYKTGTSAPSASEATTVLDEPEWYDTVIVEWIVRDKTDAELYDEEAIDENGNVLDSGGLCSGKNTDWENGETSKCCKNCQKYIKKLMKAIANVTDDTYSYYTPYIARVLGSWFRDTYFVIPEQEDQAISDYIGDYRNDTEMAMIENSYGTNGTYVVVDEEYLEETGEYWTSYEMVPETDSDGNVVTDSAGNIVYTEEYQLYYMEPNGTTSDTTMEDWIEENGYSSREEAEEAGAVFIKKAKTNTTSNLSSSSLDKVVWSAYEFGDGGETGWTKITNYESNDYIQKVYDQIESSGGEIKNTDDGGFYYNISSTTSVTQTEDAQRSQTNATVKWLFKYRKYYLYDGSSDTALAIAEDKEKVIIACAQYLSKHSDGVGNWASTGGVATDLGTYGRSALRDAYGSGLTFRSSWFESDTDRDNGNINNDDIYELAEQWLEWQLDMYYSGDTDGTCSHSDHDHINGKLFVLDQIDWENYGIDVDSTDGVDPRNQDLIGTVNITKNSLNAFSILENTETYAAEYAYRDFKELIVELDYFDKEDLSDAISSVFTWVLPDIDSTGWPNRPWDKQDNEYGALIESSTTYAYLDEVDYDPTTMSVSATSDDEDEEIEDDDTTDDTTTDSTDTTITEDTTETEDTEESTDTDDETSSTSDSYTFEGYTGGEAVVSPVTGKVLSYGTHKRTNVYTGDTEIVGFITIEAMSTENQLTSSDVSVNSASDEGNSEITDEEIATIYGYFAEEYEDTCQGYVITIDGINVDLNLVVEDSYGVYEVNEVAKLYNKDTQTEREEEEEEKCNAPFFINVGGSDNVGSLIQVTDYTQENVVYTCSDDCTYYIKEGKYIGTTMTDEEAEARIIEEGTTTVQTVTYGEEDGDVTTSDFTYEGPANYMKIMMKDTNYSIVDDIEEYFDIPDPADSSSSGTLFTNLSEEILYWILVDCEGTVNWNDSSNTSGTTDLGDGTITTSFGVTNHCESIAESLGYGDYWPMSLGDTIPNSVVSDVAIAFLDATLETLQSKYPDRTFTETQMAALMSVYYNFGHVPDSIDELLSDPSASDQDIYDVWSSIRSYGYDTYGGWEARDKAESNMWLSGEWYECYSGVKIRFITETPYSDFLENSSAQVYESAE